jgi:hypothetical protein
VIRQWYKRINVSSVGFVNVQTRALTKGHLRLINLILDING